VRAEKWASSVGSAASNPAMSIIAGSAGWALPPGMACPTRYGWVDDFNPASCAAGVEVHVSTADAPTSGVPQSAADTVPQNPRAPGAGFTPRPEIPGGIRSRLRHQLVKARQRNVLPDSGQGSSGSTGLSGFTGGFRADYPMVATI